MERLLIFFQRYILSKSYVLMDLEFMILDALDYMRPSQKFKKFESHQEADAACRKIEQFEREHFQIGYREERDEAAAAPVDADRNDLALLAANRRVEAAFDLLSRNEAELYDDLIDRLANEFDSDEDI